MTRPNVSPSIFDRRGSGWCTAAWWWNWGRLASISSVEVGSCYQRGEYQRGLLSGTEPGPSTSCSYEIFLSRMVVTPGAVHEECSYRSLGEQ